MCNHYCGKEAKIMNKFWKILGSVGPVVVGIAGLIVDLAASKVQEDDMRAICREEIAADKEHEED